MKPTLPLATPFPAVDDHIVEPETREEMVRGRRVFAEGAPAPHADRHCEVNYVLAADLEPGYVGSSDLLTRQAEHSNFATDTCIRREGTDPSTGRRYLEEVCFEVVYEQSLRDVTERAEDLVARGVRRVLAIFVKAGEVREWSAAEGEWKRLDGSIEDRTLATPLPVSALLEAAAADNAVARALLAKNNPVLVERHLQGINEGGFIHARATLRRMLSRRSLTPDPQDEARIEDCTDLATLDRWIDQAVEAPSVADALR